MQAYELNQNGARFTALLQVANEYDVTHDSRRARRRVSHELNLKSNNPETQLTHYVNFVSRRRELGKGRERSLNFIEHDPLSRSCQVKRLM